MRLKDYPDCDSEYNCDLRRVKQDAAEGARRLQAEGIGRSMSWGPPRQHLPDPGSPVNSSVSVWSDKWFALMCHEWYFVDLNVDFSGAELDLQQTETRYHGTEWGAAW